MDFDKTKLRAIVKNLKSSKVLVIGDIILDHFIWGKVDRISPEAPVPIVEVKSESLMPGGAANVAANLKSLGVKTSLVGMTGTDANGKILKELLKKNKIPSNGLISFKKLSTIKKTRIIAHHQQIVRVDRENADSLCKNEKVILIRKIEKILPSFDAVILEDYGKGVLCQAVIDSIIKLCKKNNILSAIDPKMGHMLNISGIDIATPNLPEVTYLAKKHNYKTLDELFCEGESLKKKLGLRYLLVTLGEGGMALFHGNKKPCKIPTLAREVFDVSGAGDTVVSIFTSAVVSGATPEEAAYIANVGAGIVVGKLGTASVTPKEILENI